ncbi:hypothetical protein HK101_009814 [Irineochytrium annulatum]|nr:hypothetical protein HK101_009814 [Irineochytrium annulatum]
MLLTALLVAFLVAPASAGCYSTLTQAQFPNCTQLADWIAFHWSIDGDSGWATFGIDAEVPSNQNDTWIAVGISEAGGMKGGDGWFLLRNPTNGSYQMIDSFTPDYIAPKPDAHQDVILLTPPPPSDVRSVYTFKRSLITCDEFDQDINIGIIHNLIWAHGKTDGKGMWTKHLPTDRGTAKALLWTDPSVVVPQKPADLTTLDVRMNNVAVGEGTNYLCTHVKMPADRKYHVVEYEGLANSSLIHHIILYGCNAAPAKLGDLYECSSMEEACTRFTFGWAVGAPPVVFPAEAGSAIGVGANAYQYLALQVHYNNPGKVQGVFDNSGIRLRYTSQLRPNDIGVLTLGNEEIKIPGNSTSATVLKPNICPGDCTRKFPGNLTVVGSGPHMHMLGLNMTTQHIRNGVELAPITNRHFYDFK